MKTKSLTLLTISMLAGNAHLINGAETQAWTEIINGRNVAFIGQGKIFPIYGELTTSSQPASPNVTPFNSKPNSANNTPHSLLSPASSRRNSGPTIDQKTKKEGFIVIEKPSNKQKNAVANAVTLDPLKDEQKNAAALAALKIASKNFDLDADADGEQTPTASTAKHDDGQFQFATNITENCASQPPTKHSAVLCGALS